MANRDMTNQAFFFDKACKTVNIRVSVGAAGAVTLDGPRSKGVATVVRNSAGNWTIQFGFSANGTLFSDIYNRLVAMDAIYDTTGVGGNAKKAAGYGADVVNNTIAANGQIVIQHTGPTNSTTTTPIAIDPASGEVVFLSFTFADSDAP